MSNTNKLFFVTTFKGELKELGKRIKIARQSRGLTQMDLADMIGISSKTVSAIEVARVEVSISQMQAIAAVLEEPIGYFTGESTSTVESKLERVKDELKEIERVINVMRAEDEVKK
jgi:transcriptional regulator with XRE-family HTH domain